MGVITNCIQISRFVLFEYCVQYAAISLVWVAAQCAWCMTDLISTKFTWQRLERITYMFWLKYSTRADDECHISRTSDVIVRWLTTKIVLTNERCTLTRYSVQKRVMKWRSGTLVISRQHLHTDYECYLMEGLKNTA